MQTFKSKFRASSIGIRGCGFLFDSMNFGDKSSKTQNFPLHWCFNQYSCGTDNYYHFDQPSISPGKKWAFAFCPLGGHKISASTVSRQLKNSGPPKWPKVGGEEEKGQQPYAFRASWWHFLWGNAIVIGNKTLGSMVMSRSTAISPMTYILTKQVFEYSHISRFQEELIKMFLFIASKSATHFQGIDNTTKLNPNPSKAVQSIDEWAGKAVKNKSRMHPA